MGVLVTIIALGLLVFYGWGTIAFWNAASRERLQLLQALALWSLLAALASLIWLLGDGLLSALGAGFALLTPILWQVGLIGPRLQRYGISWKRLFFGS
jgi:hypothetical protein